MARDFSMVLAGIGGQGVLLASDILAMAALEENPENKVRTSQIKGMSQRSASVIVHLRFGPTVDSPLVAKGSADALLSFELSEGLRYRDYLKEDAIVIINSDVNIPPVTLHGVKVTVDQSLCYGCGNCLSSCQVNYYFKGNHDLLVLNSPASSIISGKCVIQESCTGCGQCFSVCPRSAKKLLDKTAYPETEQIVNILKKITNNVFIIPAMDYAKDLGNPKVANMILLGVLLGIGKIPLGIKTVKSCVSKLIPENLLDINLKAFQKGLEKGREIIQELKF
ncbi:MAG: 2-oxoacid:acceptor oxidoreductase family protein [Candidatus Jordarchaeaceae archaeon]